eukprot:22235-Prymnesium_polylepis.2
MFVPTARINAVARGRATPRLPGALQQMTIRKAREPKAHSRDGIRSSEKNPSAQTAVLSLLAYGSRSRYLRASNEQIAREAGRHAAGSLTVHGE